MPFAFFNSRRISQTTDIAIDAARFTPAGVIWLATFFASLLGSNFRPLDACVSAALAESDARKTDRKQPIPQQKSPFGIMQLAGDSPVWLSSGPANHPQCANRNTNQKRRRVWSQCRLWRGLRNSDRLLPVRLPSPGAGAVFGFCH